MTARPGCHEFYFIPRESWREQRCALGLDTLAFSRLFVSTPENALFSAAFIIFIFFPKNSPLTNVFNNAIEIRRSVPTLLRLKLFNLRLIKFYNVPEIKFILSSTFFLFFRDVKLYFYLKHIFIIFHENEMCDRRVNNAQLLGKLHNEGRS
ncbi:hypothetical protein PUN28_013433 [Cardiocondyla obscurior]|uniref:Uncharacterized protein n=1 Tax=Cardiocondyla obscurior TaxID=286306 RepID=A0AAW2F187_9HYME